MPNIKFTNQNAVFFNILRQRVNDYFSINQIKQTGSFRLYFKSIILIAALIACYVFLVFFTPDSAWIATAVCGLLGLILAAIGFNIMHDGAHGSYSSNKTLNNLMAYTLNMMGGSSFIWKQKHNNNHHSYTNIEGMDDDIDIKPFIRTNKGQKKYWFHRFQHIYGFLLYGLTYLFWVFFQDFKKYFSGKVSDISLLRKMNLKEHILFWVTKCSYVFIFLIIPAYNTGIINTLLGYGMMVFACGFVIAIVFQLAHIFEDAKFVIPGNDSMNIESEWAIHQINSTANFTTRNKIVSWFCGGLNFQIEHHLFPKISHIHYPEISKIVRDTCSEFNIMYKEFPSVLSALRSHFIHLKKQGSL